MGYIINIPLKYAEFIKNNSSTMRSVEEIEYANKIMLNTLGVLLSSLIPAIVLGQFKAAIIVLINFALLRFFSGGKHIESSIMCIITSTSLILCIIFLNKYVDIDNIRLILSIVTFTTLLLFAPRGIDSHYKFKLKIKTKYIFKIVSLLIIIVNIFYIDSSLLTYTYLFQATTLLLYRGK